MGSESVGALQPALRCYLVLALQLLTQLMPVDSALRYKIAEEGPPDVRIGNVAADLGLSTSGIGTGDVTFALESGAEYFKIDNVTGELTTSSRRIDREKLPQCQMIFDENECFLDFEVSVIGPLQSWVDLFEGRIVITDVNDNTPSFPSPVLTLSVEENRPIGTLYLLPTATDRDFGRNGIDRYELVQDSRDQRRPAGASMAAGPNNGGADRRRSQEVGSVPAGRSNVFELQVADTPDGQKQPQLIVKGPLDREARDSYELMLRVRDGGSPPRSSQALLRVAITDVNDNSPRFERAVYEAEMAENTPPGTPVLQVRASDRDIGVNGQVEYVFGAATESVRRILRLDEASGWLSVLHRIDREEVSQLRFTVTARDRGQPPRTDRATVILNVRDENDNVPVVEIRKIGRILVRDGVAMVPENVLVDTPVALVQVSDRDQGENGAVTCTVVGDVPFTLKPAGENALAPPPPPTDDAFERNKKKFFLHTSALLDYEATRDYSVTIVAVDSGSPSLSSNSTLMVRVVDINDHAPTFAQSLVEVHFAENNAPGERVVTVVAADADSGKNAEIAYSLDPSVNGAFYIDADNGDIRATGALDREQRERYEFRVIARDKGSPSLQGSTTVVVQVTDRNDNAPKFVQEVFTFYVKENLLANSPVGMVTVTDADEGENAELSLFVEEDEEEDEAGGRKPEMFSIENNTGTIFSAASFDRESRSTYTFRVRAVDGGEPPRSATATVSLFVTDENDNAPAVTAPANESYTLLPPASGARTVVRTVTASDGDTGSNADLRFALVGGNPFRLFEIGPNSGVITLAEPLERRHRGLHRLVVRVNDSGVPSLCATALVHVFINESLTNATLVDAQVARSLSVPLSLDIAGDPDTDRVLGKQRLSVAIGVLAGAAAVILVILLVVTARQCGSQAKNGYEAGKKEPEEDFFSPQPPPLKPQGDRGRKPRRDKRGANGSAKNDRSLYSGIVTVNGCRRGTVEEEEEDEEVSNASERIAARYCAAANGDPSSPRLGARRHQSSPDLARHYKSSSPLPAVHLQPNSPPAEGKKHQAVQELPPTNTFTGGNADAMSLGSDQCSDYSCHNAKYNKQPLRRVTFSVATQPQDPGCYDSGVEDSETPSSKSSSGPRIGVLPLPEDGYERTTPEGSVGEEEHVENDPRHLPDVALTGKCTRDCDEFGHSDACWMPVRPSPRKRQPGDPSAGDDNNNHEDDSEREEIEEEEEEGGEEDEGSDQGSGGGGAEDARGSLSNVDQRNRNMGDHNRNLLNRKMTSASYDTFSSAGFGHHHHHHRGNEQEDLHQRSEVIPLTRTGGGDYKTTSCLTLSRREVYL
ncbi:protocadherin-7 [Pygocentrus nattereri]|uniref:Cadherin domain-containing protein n=1 Tax=Pygocentrus nattereri TaxID=42514 RepID=A0A3B4D9B8_PYGNA|nr:protocadherin-7 [Pygocentrus nattereri]